MRKIPPPYEPPLSLRITRRAIEMLQDGQWHEREKLVRELMKMIPPGVAVRRAEQVRKDANARRGADPSAPRTRHVTREEQIRIGQRSIAQVTFASANGKGSREPAFELSEDKKQVRMVREHRVAMTDRLRGEQILPILDGLAERFRRNDEVFQSIRSMAHDYGLHLARCPKGCTLAGDPAPAVKLDE